MANVNHMSHSRTGDPSTGGYRYNIAPIHSNYQVHYALASPWARDPEYVKGIIRSYVENKRIRGKTSGEVGTKLNLLEKELPSFLQSFCDVREQYSLPPSPWVRRPGYGTSSSQYGIGTGPSRRVSSATTSRYNIANPSMSYFEGYPGASAGSSSAAGSPLTRTTTAPGRQQSGDRRTSRLSAAGASGVNEANLPAEFRVRRQNTEDADEPPPPPYARQDPEPDSTRLLAERLAAEQGPGGAGAVYPEAEPQGGSVHASPNAAAQDGPVSGSGSGSGQGSTPGQGDTPSGTAPSESRPGPSPPVSSHSGRQQQRPVPPPRVQSQSQSQSQFRPPPQMPGSYNPPTSPPPQSASAASGSGGDDGTGGERPSLPRSESEQLRMAYEESQFEEAKRASMAAEREREEMERAIQMSLEAEEADAIVKASAQYSSGSGSGAGAGAGSGAGPLDVRPGGGPGYGGHGGMAHGGHSGMAMGGYQGQYQANGPAGAAPYYQNPSSSLDPFANSADVNHLSGRMAESSLLDEPDEGQYLSIPPMHTGTPIGASHTGSSSNPGLSSTPQPQPPALSPRLKSRNPFLSPHEFAKPLPRPPSQSLGRASSSSLRPNYSGSSSSGAPNGFSPGQSAGSPGLPGTAETANRFPPIGDETHSHQSPPPASPGYNPVQFQPAQQVRPGQAEGALRVVVIVDDGADVQGFDKAQEIVQGLITQAKLDVYFVNSKRVGKDIESAEDVQELFGGLSPRGSASLGARLDYLLHEQNIIVITDGSCARSVARRAKQLRINPSLPAEQLLVGAPPDDLEKVLETRVGRVHFVLVGGDDEGKAGLASLTSKGMSMGIYTGLSEEFVQETLW